MVDKESSTGRTGPKGTLVPNLGLTEDVIDSIAEKAADKVLDRVYREVGKSVIRKAAWAVGVLILAFLSWLGLKGGIR